MVKNILVSGGGYGFIPLLLVVLLSCSFDYGNKEAEGRDKPDLIMENVDYVRIRGGDPAVRFRADLAERYEEKQIMNLKKLSFEQYDDHGDDINSSGSAGNANVELESGNIILTEDVFISIDTEDLTIQTTDLKWLDKEKQLFGPATNAVDINRSDGTRFHGVGFSADVRYRSWIFDSGVSGVFVEEDEDEDEEPQEEEFPPMDDFLW